eukprot:TRINITY_DN5283_c0_g3_i1.p1 TRINITY_DN5283_c0_g3~~TRINITY_DN5283_c0_g3_i1.p1  ORF type:complete len:2707 (+),score=404.80 TRINITY_DN5283_c0_g3_i1:200-8320(+)
MAELGQSLHAAFAAAEANSRLGKLQANAKKIKDSAAKSGGVCLGRTGVSELLGCGPCQYEDDDIDDDVRVNRLVESSPDDAGIIGPPLESSGSFVFRLCVHHGDAMPAEQTFIQVVIDSNNGSPDVFESRVVPASQHPTWDFLVKHQLELDGQAPNVEIKIMASRLLGNRHLGSAYVALPPVQPHDIQREELKVRQIPGPIPMLDTKLNSKLLVVWQLASPDKVQPDLSRVAEMDSTAVERRKIQIVAGARCARLARPASAPQQVSLTFSLHKIDYNGDHIATFWEAAVRPENTEPKSDPKSSVSAGKDVNNAAYSQANWTGEGKSTNGYMLPHCQLHESEVGLTSYELSITGVVSSGGKRIVLGSYSETLATLHELIIFRGSVLHFWAELHSEDIPSATALVEVTVDIYGGREGPHTGLGGHDASASKIHVRAGRLRNTAGDRQVQYFASIVGWGLPVRDPFVKIFMACSSGESQPVENHVEATGQHIIAWEDPIPVLATRSNRKARFEVWNNRTRRSYGTFADELLAQATIYEALPHNTYWRHLYGGSLNPNFPDEAERMARGSIRPSTYHGSIALHFGTRPKAPPGFTESLVKQLKKVTLTVRLYRGLYLDMYAGDDVTILIQFAGATVSAPDAFPNKNLLAFPAKVSKTGLLRFEVPEDESRQKGGFSWFGKDELEVPKLSWVERSTPEHIPLLLSPHVTHAYLYIVRVGEEELPPNVFGRLPLRDNTSQTATHVQTWERLYYDRSMVKLSPNSQAEDDLAGFILGSALLGSYDLDRKVIVQGMQHGCAEKDLRKISEWCERKLGTVGCHRHGAALQGPSKLMLTFDSAEEARRFINADSADLIAGIDDGLPLEIASRTLMSDSITDSHKQAISSKGLCTAPEYENANLTIPAADSPPQPPNVSIGISELDIVVKPVDVKMMLPQVTQPVSVICQPCTGQHGTVLQKGSPGERVRYHLEPRPEDRNGNTVLRDVYCHVDILAARSLTEADEDGLADPCYQIRVEDKVFLNPKNHTRSLDPTFLHRVVVGPIQFEVKNSDEDRLPQHHHHPLPPIMVKLLDKDTALAGKSFFVMGRAVVENPISLDALGNGIVVNKGEHVLDLNQCHTPIWYALHVDASAPFAFKDVESFWRHRPRLLMATGYSCIKRVKPVDGKEGAPEVIKETADGYCTTIQTEKTASYRITIDLLGLRNILTQSSLSTNLGIAEDLELKISSFWEGPAIKIPIAFASADSDIQNPNFSGKKEDARWQSFKAIMRDIVHFQGFEKQGDVSEQMQVAAPSRPDSTDSSRIVEMLTPSVAGAVSHEAHGMTVDKSSVRGWRAIAPIYTVQVIPYLQSDRAKVGAKIDSDLSPDVLQQLGVAPLRPADSPSDTNVEHKGNIYKAAITDDDPFVLMPDLVFQLRSYLTHGEHGSLSLHLPLGCGDLDYKIARDIEDANDIARVVHQWSPPTESTPTASSMYLQVDEGDRIHVRKRDQPSGWTYGEMLGSDSVESGWFPSWAIQNDSGISWAEQSALEYKSLPENLKHNVHPFKNINEQGDDAYEVYIDVFAAQDGLLKWDTNLQVGRSLLNQHLFTITEDRMGRDESTEPPSVSRQYFNPADWMFGDDRFADEPFDWRVQPSLRCARLSEDGKEWTSTRVKEDGRHDEEHEMPKHAGELFDELLGRVSKLSATAATVKVAALQQDECKGEILVGKLRLEHVQAMSTQELSQFAQLCGYRCLSHQHRPEKLPSNLLSLLPTSMQAMAAHLPLPEKRDTGLESAHLHTYIRPIGHQIRAQDRDTRFLARLRVGLPAHLSKKTGNMATAVEFKDAEGRQIKFSLQPTGLVFVTADGAHIARLSESAPPRIEEVAANMCKIFVQSNRILVKENVHNHAVIDKVLSLFQQPEGTAQSQDKERRPQKRKPTETTQKIYESQNTNFNFLVVKFNRPGTIVWAPPKETALWTEPGSVLFVVEVQDGGGSHVVVRMPSFDLRFEQECIWLPVKTLAPSSGFDVKSIKARLKIRRERDVKGTSKLTQNVKERHGGNDNSQNNLNSENAPAPATLGPDGYSLPIPVTKYAFCCRILKRRGSNQFDRPRTSNWYRQVLKNAFPEVGIPQLDKKADNHSYLTKHFFLARYFNLRQYLVRGDTGEKGGLLKGHVNVQKATDDDFKVKTLPAGEKRKSERFDFMKAFSRSSDDKHHPCELHLLPVQNLWMSSEVTVNFYLLTARDIHVDQGVVLREPYVILQIPGDPKIHKEKAQVFHDETKSIDFYTHMSINCELPGSGILRVEIWTKGSMTQMNNSMIGYLEVDLEDRWTAIAQKKLREASSKRFLEQNIMPKDELKVKVVKDPAPVGDRARWNPPLSSAQLSSGHVPADQTSPGSDVETKDIAPHLAPGELMPIETRQLTHPDPLQAGRHMGAIRLWVDMLPEQESYRHVRFRDVREAAFQIRMKIIGIKGISVFKDLGERNDVYIKGRFVKKCPGQHPVVVQKKTDTHRWARYEADFNWTWVFNVCVPLNYCSLELFVMDEDTLTENDMMYGSKVLPFDDALLLATEWDQQGNEPMGPIKYQVVFDTYPAGRDGEGTERDLMPYRVWRCCRRVVRHKPRPPPGAATLHVEIEIVTAQDALLHPVEDNACFLAPKTRQSWNSAIADPGKFLFDLIGPWLYTHLKQGFCCCSVALSLLVFLGILYLLMQAVLLPAIYVHDQMNNDKFDGSSAPPGVGS